MINIYKILTIFLIPFIKLNIRFRILQGKEMPLRFRERYGISETITKNKKEVIWIHAASIGEFKTSDFLIEKYFERFTILITTTTVSAANYAVKNYGDKIIHQFAPLDVSIWVKRFLNNWKPKLIIWIESDLWPNTMLAIKKNKINSILLNVRMSPKSFKRWGIIPSFYNNLLNCFTEVFAQSKIDLKRIKTLSNKNIKFIGNLKLTNLNYNTQKKRFFDLENDQSLIRVMLTSTHANEEAQLLPIFKKLMNEYDNLRIIIAPRHPQRSNEIMSLCASNKIHSQLESEKILNLNNLIIINSFGILSNYFSISDIVFLGGSLISAGGHNPIEPAVHKCAILTGPQLFNWENIYDDMEKNNACLKINSLEDFEESIRNLLDNKNKIEILKTNAYKFSQKQFVDTNFLVSIIDSHMKIKPC